jgi:hypothetical protein
MAAKFVGVLLRLLGFAAAGSALKVKNPFGGLLGGLTGGLIGGGGAAIAKTAQVAFSGQEYGAGDSRLKSLFDFGCGTDAEFWQVFVIFQVFATILFTLEFVTIPRVPGATPTACQLQCRDAECSNAKTVCAKHGCNAIAYNVPTFASGRIDLYATLKKTTKPTPSAVSTQEHKNPMEGLNQNQVLAYVASSGWASSKVVLSKNQRHRGTIANCPSLYNGNCNGNGENLLGRCFCFVGFAGKDCSVKAAAADVTCNNKDDRCFYTAEAGVFAISFDRWKAAQYAEGATWAQSR